MKQERLDSLMMLGIHRKRGDKLDLDSVVDRFMAKFPKCRISLWICMFFLCKLSITTLPKVLCFREGHSCLNFLLYKLCIFFLLLEVYKLYWYAFIIFLYTLHALPWKFLHGPPIGKHSPSVGELLAPPLSTYSCCKLLSYFSEKTLVHRRKIDTHVW